MKNNTHFTGKNLGIYLIISFLILLLAYGIWYFFFNIYEVKYRVNFVKNLENGERVFEVQNLPLNLLGNKVPLRKLDFEFELKEGDTLINILQGKNKKELFFKTNSKNGKIKFVLKTDLSLFPQIIEFDLSENFKKEKLN